MAGFHITKPYTMPKAKLRAAAKGLAKELEQQHGVRSRWNGDTVHISGAGINGEMPIASAISTALLSGLCSFLASRAARS